MPHPARCPNTPALLLVAVASVALFVAPGSARAPSADTRVVGVRVLDREFLPGNSFSSLLAAAERRLDYRAFHVALLNPPNVGIAEMSVDGVPRLSPDPNE